MRSEVNNWTEVIWVSGFSEYTAFIFKSFAPDDGGTCCSMTCYPHDYKL